MWIEVICSGRDFGGAVGHPDVEFGLGGLGHGGLTCGFLVGRAEPADLAARLFRLIAGAQQGVIPAARAAQAKALACDGGVETGRGWGGRTLLGSYNEMVGAVQVDKAAR